MELTRPVPPSAGGISRPRRGNRYTGSLLGVLLAAILMASLVGACSKSSSPGSTSANATGAAAAASGNGADPGVCPTHSTTSFAKTKFVAHTGLAIGAFHRWIYKPFRNGSFQSGHNGRILAFVKAAASALFVRREVRLAAQDAQADPALCRAIAAPLRSFYNDVTGIGSRIRGGNTSGIDAAQGSATGLTSTSSSDGVPIQENQNVSF